MSANAEYVPIGNTYDMKKENSQDSIADEFLESLWETESGATVRVYRQSGSGKQAMSLLESFPIDKYAYDEMVFFIRDNYGAGDYRVMVSTGGPGGLKGNRLITIEEPRSKKASGDSDLSAVLAMVMQKMDEQNQKLIAAMQRAPEKSDNGMAQLKETVGLLKDMGLLGAPVANKGEITSIKETIELLKVMGMTVEPVGGGGGGDSLFSVVEKFVPVLTQIAENNKGASAAERQLQLMQSVNRGASGALPVVPRETQNINENNAEEQKMIAIRLGIGALLNAARQSALPELYAPMIIEQLDESAVQNYVLGVDAWQRLCDVMPECENYKPWFDDLLEHVKAILGYPSIYADAYQDDSTIDNQQKAVNS